MLVFVGPDAGAWGRGLLHHLRWLCNSLPRRHEQVGHFLPGLTGRWLWFLFACGCFADKKKERKIRCMVLIFDMCVCVLKGPDGCDVVSSPWQREKRRNLGSLLGGPDGRDSRLSRVHQQVSKTAALISQHALRLCRDNWLGALVQSAKLHLWNFLVLRCCGLFYWIRGFCYWSKHNVRPVCHHVGLSVAVSAVLGVVGRSCSRSQFVSN